MVIFINYYNLNCYLYKYGNSSVGRASASQAEAHEYEPRLPLESETHKDDEGAV